MEMSAEIRDRALDRATPVLDAAARGSHLLEALAWPRATEEAFFAANALSLPRVTYAIDRARAQHHITELAALESSLVGDHPFFAWLRAVSRSMLDANRMLLAVGTREFYELSLAIYGGARTTALDADTTNLDFAEHLVRRVGAPVTTSRARLDAVAFAADLERRIARRQPPIPMAIVLDPDLSAKAIAGMTRVRVRQDASFEPSEAVGLYYHEIETHALTAQNGEAQSRLPFLRSGGPRTTRTQEGLAVFSELYAHALTPARLRRLTDRVQMVAMAEDGASFLDLYRHLASAGGTRHEAYLDAQRICRGGVLTGGAPFTKDASYLSGLMDVYNFLRVALRADARMVAEVLVSGRIALDDIEALMWLRAQGVLAKPKLTPRWLARWDGLLAYFAFTSFLNEVDIGPVEQRHRALLERARNVADGLREDDAAPRAAPSGLT